jgi:hypothetical protein
MRFDEMDEDLVKAILEDPERREALRKRIDEMEEADLNKQLALTERPIPKIRVLVQDTPISLRIEETSQGLKATRAVKMGKGISGLSFNDIRGSSTYLANLWDALTAIYRLELQKLGYYPKPGARWSAFLAGFGMWAEDVPPRGELPEQFTETYPCPNCEPGRLCLDPDAILKCNTCGHEPLGVVLCPGEVVDRHVKAATMGECSPASKDS